MSAPAHKGAARAGEDDHVDVVHCLQRIDRRIQIQNHLLAQSVERLRPADRQNGDVVVFAH
jgi:hypothetical protein